jgi:hypothetical protein
MKLLKRHMVINQISYSHNGYAFNFERPVIRHRDAKENESTCHALDETLWNEWDYPRLAILGCLDHIRLCTIIMQYIKSHKFYSFLPSDSNRVDEQKHSDKPQYVSSITLIMVSKDRLYKLFSLSLSTKKYGIKSITTTMGFFYFLPNMSIVFLLEKLAIPKISG